MWRRLLELLGRGCRYPAGAAAACRALEAKHPDVEAIDVYPGNGFLEFEEQGPYAMIAASGTVAYAVEWKAVKVPTSISVAVSSTALLDFAKQQVAQ